VGVGAEGKRVRCEENKVKSLSFWGLPSSWL